MLITVLFVAAILFGALGWGSALAEDAATVCRCGSFALGFVAFVCARPVVEAFAQARMPGEAALVFMIFSMLGIALLPNFVGGLIARAGKRTA